MRHFKIVLFFCLIYVAKSNGQTVSNKNYYVQIDVEITKANKPKRIWSKVELRSTFPDGDSAWVQSLEKRIDQLLTYRNGAKRGKYNFSAKFIVMKDGSTSDVQCVNDPGFGMGAAVIRVLKNQPRWRPVEKPVIVRERPGQP